MHLRKLILLSTALAGFAPVAHAQTAAEPPVDDETQSYRDDAIVVTAQKRSESINDVASSVTAFTSEARQKIGIDSLSDFAKFTPGLSYDAGGDRVFLRGIGRQTNTAGSDPGVATYIDGIYDSSTVGLANSDFFVERVEVLRGPQGTLYGRNSIGGAINAISKRPTDTLTIEGRATAANYDAYILQGAISGPVTDDIRVRVGASWSDQNKGYFRNVAGGPSEGGVASNLYVEGQIEADLGPDATLWLKAFTGRSTGRPRTANFLTPYDYEPYSDLAPGAAFGFLLPGYDALGDATQNPGVDDPRLFSTDTVSRSRLRGNFGGSGQLDIRLDPFDIRILGGYREYRYNSRADLDNTSMKAYDFPLSPGAVCGFIPGCTPLRTLPSSSFNYLEDRSYGSAEINFLSKGTGNFNWIAGLYYFAEELNQESRFSAEEQPQVEAPVNGPANPGGDLIYAATRLKMSSYAAFGQIDWDVTETVRLTGGLRYTYDEKQATEQFRAVCLGCAPGLSPDQLGSFTPGLDITSSVVSALPAPGVAGPLTIDPVTGRARRVLQGGWSAVTGTAGVQWRPDRDTLAYLSYSRGYKSGGFNAGGITAFPEADSEHVDAFELGVKKGVGPLQLNVAGYYYKYKNLQIPLSVPQPAGVDLVEFLNLDDAKSYGVEVEAQWRVTDGFNLLLNYSYADSEITACCFIDVGDPMAIQPGAQPQGDPVAGGRQPQSLDGERLPHLPRHKVTANANYTFDVGPGAITLSATYTWRDKMFGSVFNRYYSELPSHDRVDARLLWTGRDDRYRITFFVKNLFNTTGFDGVSDFDVYGLALDPDYSVERKTNILPPRTYGVQLQFKI